MVARYGRRTLVGIGVSALGALVTGSYAWSQYRTRHSIRLYHLEAVNESDETVRFEVSVTDEAGDREGTRTVTLDPTNGNESHLSGHWMKHAGEWRVEASVGDRRLELTATEIRARLEDAGWGTDCANVQLVATADGELESRVTPSDVC
ncbi:hypothetical protein [Natronolimnohabitans innermongolicus]|uniref:Uncharacterized protein n=1 Tax=Natronolimnohabitans innermongolicus JCM 12255 TaxID=1227499 RepID=L9XJ26_9EURY|nr:hypothetical protein [Natronolimnohabitans innermongolicus]ELY60663.1 hypothetical protein C493_04281 [Natronolimnohabitans innermongolicus JCM 12255]